MANNCDKNCNNCSQDCADRVRESVDAFEKLNVNSRVGKVIGIVSGKGGVGKSLVTSMSAVAMSRKGYRTAILDADVTGPSIPKIFGLSGKAMGNQFGVLPAKTKTGIDVMSINLLLENDSDPVIWRGPLIAGVIKQFWSDVIWDDIDFMFIDMPPGTGDVPLTVFQSLPVDGIIIVTSPQELVSMIVAKATRMAEMMNIPILGLVENMSYFKCPDCGKEHAVFQTGGDSAKKYGIEVLARLPIDPRIASACDNGTIEFFDGCNMDGVVKALEGLEGVKK